MQDMYANSSFFKLMWGNKKALENPPRLELILFQNYWFKFDIAWFILWSLAQKEVLKLLHTYVVVLTLGTLIPVTECNSTYIPLFVDT